MGRSLLTTVLVATVCTMVFAAATGTAAAAVVSASPPAIAGQDPGSVGVRLVDVPTDARNDPRAQQYIVDRLAPGAVIHRRIQVSNTTTSPIRVAMYAAAASIANGTFLGAAGHTPDALSSWTTLDRDSLEIAPAAQMLATLTVTVPLDAAPGEQYAAVWVETGTANTTGVKLVNRVGIRLYVSVGAGNAPPSNFTVESLTAQRAPDGHPVVVAQVRNTGGRALDLTGSLSLSDGPGSLNAGPFRAQLVSTLAPGQSAPVDISLDRQLPDGPWTASISLTSGLLENHYQARIQFPAGPGATAPVAPQPTGIGGYLPVLAGMLILILVVAAVLVIIRRRARRNNDHPLV
ncbi:MAG: hypothetical protein QOG20_682 [Pseudonocardiales bacterium]|nr:hypothetical protein [Pseudonocardiales bacterium]